MTCDVVDSSGLPRPYVPRNIWDEYVGYLSGIAGMIDVLRGMGERFLALGYSTPFLEMGSTYMYSDLEVAKDAVRCAPQ